MTIQFNTGIESLDRLQFKTFPRRKTKADWVAKIEGRDYAVAGDTVYTEALFLPLNDTQLHRPTLDQCGYWNLLFAATKLGLVNKADAAEAIKQQQAHEKAKRKRDAALSMASWAKVAGITLTAAQRRKVRLAAVQTMHWQPTPEGRWTGGAK